MPIINSGSNATTNSIVTSSNTSTIEHSIDRILGQRKSEIEKNKLKPKRQNSVGNTDSESTSETE